MRRKKVSEQFKSWVMRLMNSKLVANFGTWRIDNKDIIGITLILYFPNMEDNVSFVTWTLLWPELIEYGENKEDRLIMWSKAPESIMQDRDMEEAWRAVACVPDWIEANDEEEGGGVAKGPLQLRHKSANTLKFYFGNCNHLLRRSITWWSKVSSPCHQNLIWRVS